jgi:hypothetical protein
VFLEKVLGSLEITCIIGILDYGDDFSLGIIVIHTWMSSIEQRRCSLATERVLPTSAALSSLRSSTVGGE